MALCITTCYRWPPSYNSFILFALALVETLAGCEGQRYLTSISITAPDATTHATTHDPSETTNAIILGSLPHFNRVEPREIYTPLQKAVMTEERDIVHNLIKKGADINEASASGKTPLHYAVMKQSYAMAELLLKSGARVDIKDNVGRKPIDYWESGREIQLLQLLQLYEESQSKGRR
jgi:Ankyrin repeats (3 copies)